MCASIHARWAMLLILSVCTLAQAQKGIDLVVVDFWERKPTKSKSRFKTKVPVPVPPGIYWLLTVNNPERG